MVFLLEDIAKIEKERGIDTGVVEAVIYVQESYDIFNDSNTYTIINSIIEQYVEGAQHYVWRNEITGVLGVFTDAFLNAGMWGNKNEPGKRVKVGLKYGSLGSVLSIEDEGEGFNYLSQIYKLQNGQQHDFSYHGGGLKKFHNYHGFISYHGMGNKMSIATKVFSIEEFERFFDSK